LAEGLRTLVLQPSRTAGPGETIRAEFSFSNFGGATAGGVVVRFSHPPGTTRVEGSDLVDDRPLAGGSLVDAAGAAVGDLEPNQQRRVACSFRVDDTIEDGTELIFQAALISDQTPLVGSNIERVVVRSQPVLSGSSTLVTLEAPDKPRPGDTVTVRATVVNTGSSSASDVVLMLPAPEHTLYVPRSARIDGRIVPGVEGDPFDYDSGVVAAERLAPGASLSIEYQATIESPLPDGTRIKAVGSVGAREVAEFPLASAEIVVASPVDFGGEETALTLLCDDAVSPGTRIPMMLRAVNAGTGSADFVTIAFALPAGLVYAPGSAHVDGQPVSDESIPGLTFSLGSLGAGRVVEAGITATVAVPAAGADANLPVEAALRWKGGERDFARRLKARTASRFNRARNFVEADRGSVGAREEIAFLVHVYNDGTAPERDVALRVIPGAHLEDVRVGESADEAVAYREPIDLGLIPPHHERVITVTARVASKVPDRSAITLGAVLEREGGAIDLGTSTIVVRSRPSVERASVAWEVTGNEPLRPNRFVDVAIRFVNSGSDVLRDARLILTVPPELSVERAVDARRDRDGLYFGDVPAESSHEARVTLRLLRPISGERTLSLEGWLQGKGISPVQFAPLEVPTFAEPQFVQSAQLLASPAQFVDAGERVFYEIRLRNDGDGPADRLSIRVVPTNLAVYMPSSTTLNGRAVADDGGVSQLWSQRGLALADVNPGVELRIRWEMSVMAPLPAGTTLETRAVLEWGLGQTIAIAAPALKVQAQPTLGESTIGTPISIAQTFASQELVYEAAPLPEPEREFRPALTAAPPAPEPKAEPRPEPVAEPPAVAATEYTAEEVVVDLTPIAPPQPEPAREPEPAVEHEPIEAELAPLEAEREEPETEPVPRAIADVIAANAETLAPETEPVAIEPPAPAVVAAPTLYLDLPADRLDTTLRMLDRAYAGGLVQHLFALRLLLPESAAGAPPGLVSAFATANRAMRAPLDRFFVRLRMPRLAVTSKDLEDRDSRFALRALVDQLALAPVEEPPPARPGVVRLQGPLDVAMLHTLAGELESAPLGAVTPWFINAQILGSAILYEERENDALGRYRGEILKVLTVLSELPIDEFHRVLTTSVNRSKHCAGSRTWPSSDRVAVRPGGRRDRHHRHRRRHRRHHSRAQRNNAVLLAVARAGVRTGRDARRVAGRHLETASPSRRLGDGERSFGRDRRAVRCRTGAAARS
jgi:uncharacterized repeat protein (TIGR01451 family)